MHDDQAQWVTLGFLVTVAMQVMAYDALAWRWWGVNATISRVCLRVSTDWPIMSVIMVFAIGVAVGHVFLYQTPPR